MVFNESISIHLRLLYLKKFDMDMLCHNERISLQDSYSLITTHATLTFQYQKYIFVVIRKISFTHELIFYYIYIFV